MRVRACVCARASEGVGGGRASERAKERESQLVGKCRLRSVRVCSRVGVRACACGGVRVFARACAREALRGGGGGLLGAVGRGREGRGAGDKVKKTERRTDFFFFFFWREREQFCTETRARTVEARRLAAPSCALDTIPAPPRPSPLPEHCKRFCYLFGNSVWQRMLLNSLSNSVPAGSVSVRMHACRAA